jgi:hypothetical protein
VAAFTGRVHGWLAPGNRSTWVGAVVLYCLVVGTYLLVAPSNLLTDHTQYNHYAHLARAWLNGRLDLADGPPPYAHNNDFAHYNDRWYVAFPPFPAVILLPFVALAKEPELVRDGQIFLWLSGLAPTLLFFALQRLSKSGYTGRSTFANWFLALCFACGSVFFFTAVQGTVWFAAHVVGTTLAAAYLWSAIEARRPLLAGLALGLGLLTRPPLAFAAGLFAVEAVRTSLRASNGANDWSTATGVVALVRRVTASVDWPRLVTRCVWFGVPLALCLAFTYWHNYARFDSPFETGYQYLTVAWQARMKKWGLFHYHYLARNLGVVFTMLPWIEDGKVPFRINVHGLALWFTTPMYLWLLWPKVKPAIHWSLWVTVALVAVPTLFYQNTGWAQFGYRFSNDYAVFLFALLALGGRRFGVWFCLAVVWAIAVNAFGAATFERGQYRAFYHWDGSQRQFYQPD